MDTISDKKGIKARKEYKCDFCCDKIPVGSIYNRQTNIAYGDLYEWKSHMHCREIALKMDMYKDADDGVDTDHFTESIRWEYRRIKKVPFIVYNEPEFTEMFSVVLNHHNIKK